MASRPAWGGTIPLVPIGSFRDFLGQRRKGKTLRQWYTGTITRAAVAASLRTPLGRRAAGNLITLIRLMGFKSSGTQIAIELDAYIAFQKFQHNQAVRRKNEAAQRAIEAVMFAPGGRIAVNGRKAVGWPLIPAEYFKMLSAGIGRPPVRGTGGRPLKPDDLESPALQAFAIWFERRKRRKGRFRNV